MFYKTINLPYCEPPPSSAGEGGLNQKGGARQDLNFKRGLLEKRVFPGKGVAIFTHKKIN